MIEDLLNQEKEFRRLNSELEEKNRAIMKEVEIVLSSNYDALTSDLIDNSKLNSGKFQGTSLTFDRDVEKKKSKVNVDAESNSDSNSFDTYVSSMKQKPEIQNFNTRKLKSKDNNQNKNIVSFFETKIAMLHTELQELQADYEKKLESYKNLDIDNKKLLENKSKQDDHIQQLRDTICRLEHNNLNFKQQCDGLTNENNNLKKDVDALKKEIKTLSQQLNSYDVRLNRCTEDNDKLKQAIKFSNTQEKDLRFQIRKLQEEKTAGFKNLEKQKTELIQIFKKQSLLVDNLKKQNAYLTASVHLKITEKDFSRLLDCKSWYTE